MNDLSEHPEPLNEKQLVSVIMPLYNSEATVRESINSVLNQSYRNLELLVIDDCSSDAGPFIVAEIAKLDERVRFIRLDKNSGAGVARNEAIRRSSGRYIAFLDSDDQWEPNKLRMQIEVFSKYDVALVCSGFSMVNARGEFCGTRQPIEWITYRALLRENLVGCLTAVYDAGKAGKRFMPGIRKRQDYSLWLDILREFGPAYCIQEPLAQYLVHPNSISARKIEMIKWNYQMFRVAQEFSPASAALLTLGNAFRKVFNMIGARRDKVSTFLSFSWFRK